MHLTVDDSPLLKRISEALSAMQCPDCVLHVSVANEPVWEKSSGGDEVRVRWLCWSIESDNAELVSPQFEVLSPAITFEQLAEDLPRVFERVKVVVDNEIEV